MITILIRLLALLSFCAVATVSLAASDPLWLRDPAISPDGKHIAFRYRGQIWIVRTSGGDASSLTPGNFHSASPVWSPDSGTIAFAADRFGAMNIFAVSASGGEAKRLTWYSAGQIPLSFTPDGKAILFASPGLGDAMQTFVPSSRGEEGMQLYQVPVTGGRETMVLPNPALDARWNKAGTQLLYTGASVEQPFRKGQTSSAARQIWWYDASNGQHKRLFDDKNESRDAVWAPDGSIYYLGEASGSLNVWHLAAIGQKPEQVTRLTGDPVRSLSISGDGDIAFSWGGGLYRISHGTSEPVQIAVNIGQATVTGERSFQTSLFDDLVPSPTGREIALVTRGDIYVASLNGENVRRITNTPGEERDPSFSPDGRRISYGAERDGHWGIYETSIADSEEKNFYDATTLEEKQLVAGKDDAMSPTYAPDGKHIAYIANRESVRVFDITDNTDTEILPKGRNFFADDWSWWLSWSPDSKWVALPDRTSLLAQNVAIAPADGSRAAVSASPSGEYQSDARWSQDGGMLVWATNPDGRRFAYHEPWTVDIEGIHASGKAREAFEKKLRIPVGDDATPRAEGNQDRTNSSAEGTDGGEPETADAKSKSREIFGFDPTGVEDRKIELSDHPAHLVYHDLMSDGVSVLTVEDNLNPRDDGYTITGLVRDLRRNRIKVLFSGLKYQKYSPVRLSKDGKKLYFLSRDGVVEVDTSRGTSRVIRVSADTSRDPAKVLRAAFDQFWMLTRKKLYDPAMHGVDWDAARTKYGRFLPSVGDPRDLAELLSEMAGDLNSSHTGSGLWLDPPLRDQTASLGLYYDERYAGPGVKVTDILTNGPFDTGDSNLKAGDIVLAINGDAIPDEGGIRRALFGRARQILAITIAHPDGTRFIEKHAAISLGQEEKLAWARWAKRKRDYVTAQSCGRLGYLYLPGMDADSYRSVFSELFGRFQSADGLIVDIRFNGGGLLHNQLLTMLSGKPYMTVVPPRGGPIMQEPSDRWTKPSAVIMNAFSYSDASIFPQAYHELKLGSLVGEPVAGTGTAVWWDRSSLVPDLVYGVPELPFHKLDGTLSEGNPINPDIPVPADPAAWAKGQDPQLDAAMRALDPHMNGVCPVAQ